MGRGEEDGMGGVRPHLGLRVLTLGGGQAPPRVAGSYPREGSGRPRQYRSYRCCCDDAL